MGKIVEEGSKEKRLNVVIPKELGEVAKGSLDSDKFTFGFLDRDGQRHFNFTLRELNGEDEEIIEGENSIVEKMMEVSKRVLMKVGTIEDRKVIEEIVLNHLCFIDLLKIVYKARYTTLGKVFKYKTICTNIMEDENNKLAICQNITTQLGDLSAVGFYRKHEGDIIDEYEVDVKENTYTLKRMTGYRQLQISRDYGVKAGGLKMANVGARLFKINGKEVDGVKEAKKMNLLTISKLHNFINEEIDEGGCDDIFVHKCSKCGKDSSTELELDSDFFSLAE